VAVRAQSRWALQGFHQDEYTDINELFPAVQQTAGLPLNAAATYAGGLGSLLSPYGTQTTTQQKKMGLADYIGLAAQIGGAFMGVQSHVGLMAGAERAGGRGQGVPRLMGLLSAIFGAKPPYGTPPFAQPHPNTGGAEVPPTPKMMFIPDGMGGGRMIPVPGTGATTGAPAAPVGKITPLDDPAPADAPPAGGTSDYYPKTKASYDSFKSAVIGQESGGRYGVANTQGSGALGVGQVMPGTARVLAGRLGLPYQPGLMAGTDATARSYQDRITEAAAREAWDASGGDPEKAAMYYFGGSNRGKWGPKTRRYASDIMSRIGG
jgi:hypothetical protein